MELQASAWWMRSRLTPQHQAEAWSSIYYRIIFLMFIKVSDSLPANLCAITRRKENGVRRIIRYI